MWLWEQGQPPLKRIAIAARLSPALAGLILCPRSQL